MKIAGKKILKSSGMDLSTGWVPKSVNTLEAWNQRFKVIESTHMHKGTKKGMSLKGKIAMSIPDILGICSMVHVKIEKR